MVDNVAITAGTGTNVAADDIGSVFYQRIKVTWGPDGTANDADVATGKPMPVQLRSPTGTDMTGAAGTAATAVQTIQGIAAMTPVLATLSGTNNIATVTTVTTLTGITNALPAGTNAIGKLAANSGVDIGDVDVTSISAGENHLGEVGGKSAVVAVTLSTDTAAYASGDLIADTQQIDAFFRKTDGTGVINSINIIDEDGQGVALYVIFMSTTTSLGSENSAPNISDANLTAGFQGIVAVATTDYVTVSGTKVATIRNIGLPVKAVSGTDDIYIAVLNSTGTPTYTAAGLEMRIGVLLD